jgi:hypothetical protein
VPRVPLVALAHVEGLQLVAGLQPPVQVRHGDALDPLDRQPLLAPARHAAGEVAADPGDPDRGGERGGMARVVVVPADDHHELVSLDQPGQLGPEPSPQRGDADRAGHVRLVELELGAYVDHERTVVAGLLHLARSERMHVHAPHHERPAVESDDVPEVWRLRSKRGDRALDELVLLGDAEHLGVRPLVPNGLGSTTAATPASSSPIRYEAQPRSS